MINVSGNASVATSVSVDSDYHGSVSNGGFVYTSANPILSLSVDNPNNVSLFSTVYRLTSSTSNQTFVYNGSFTINQNHSNNYTLNYRTNSSAGLETWNTLSISVDADPPELSISSNNQSPERYIYNSSSYVISASNPLNIGCSDNLSGVQYLQYSLGNQSAQVNSSSVNITSSILNQSTTNGHGQLNISCSDRVGNSYNMTFSLVLDDEVPLLSVVESGTRSGFCVGASWKITPTSSDNHSTSSVQQLQQSTWISAPQSISPASSGNSTIILRALDSAGHFSFQQQWSVYLDSSLPQIQTVINSTTVSVNVSDDCGFSHAFVQWETLAGQTSGWSSSLNSQFSMSTSFNGSVVRANIRAFDSVGNQKTSSTGWINTPGAAPQSSVALLNDHVGNYTNNSLSVMFTPIGMNSTVNYTLLINNQTTLSGQNNSRSYINQTLNHSDVVRLILNTSNGQGGYSVQSFQWTADNQNLQFHPVSIAGTYVSSPSLLLGANGRLLPGVASDDPSGVGGSHALCSTDGNTWFQVSSGSSHAPTSNQGSVEPFTFACRSVDLLGNEGPITWLNGSVDLQSPTLTLSPNAGETIGLNNTLTLNTSDSNGIAATSLLLTWSNGSSTSSTNVSISTLNWSNSIGQLFTGLSDGTITASAYTVDRLGNSATIASRTWTLNTSNPFISMSLGGTYYGQFITNDSTDITLSLPSGGWTGLYTNYTLIDGSGVVLSGNVTSSIQLQPTDFVEGRVWLNTTTGDSLGRIQVQAWIFEVDRSNNASVQIDVRGLNVSSPSLLLGANGRLLPGVASDDPSGVGGSHALCSTDGNTWFQVSSGSSHAPTSNQGSVEPFTFACRSVDLLGNEGPITWLNGSVDLQSPTLTLSPNAGETIGLNNTLTLNTSDSNGIAATSLLLTWSNGSSTSSTNVSISTLNWSNSIGQLFTGLSDGTITASAYTVDRLGNSATIASRTWTLNTSNPFISMSLGGTYYGQFITNDSTDITLSLPSGGWTGLYTNYTLIDGSGVVLSGNVTSSIQLQPTDFVEGRVWLNTTTGDSLGRIQVQAWIFEVDRSNNASVQIDVRGLNVSSPSLLLGANGRLLPGVASDDPSGVGGSHALCSTDGNTWFQVSSGSSHAPTSNQGSVEPFTFACRSVDLLGNEGPITWLNGSVDLQSPTLTLSPNAGETIGLNNTLTLNTSDSNGIAATSLLLTWSNGSSTSSTNVSISTLNWSNSIGQLFTGLSDGTITASAYTVDRLGNSATIASRTWTLNTSNPFISMSLGGTYYGQFITNDSTDITLSLPSGGWTGLYTNYTLIDGSGVVLSGNVTSSIQLQPTDFVEGRVWLNTTTGDSLGRIQVQAWIFEVDRSNNASVLISLHGLNATVNGLQWVGPQFNFSLGQISDDSWGVGADEARCSWNNDSWFSVILGDHVSPSFQSGQVGNATIFCQNVDRLGNLGPISTINVSIDAVLPEITLLPSSGAIISPQTTLSSLVSDNLLNGSYRIFLHYQSAGDNRQYHNISAQNSQRNFSVANTFTNLNDGTISATVFAEDFLGNLNQSSTFVWTLNTTMPSTTVLLSGQYYQDYTAASNFSITLGPSTIGNQASFSNYSLTHQNGSQISNGNVSSSITISFCDDCNITYPLTAGRLYLNITTYDIFSRQQTQSIIFFVDVGVGTAPSLSYTGPSTSVNGTVVLGSDSRVELGLLSDDAGGVGVSTASCSYGGSTWFNATSNASFSPPSSENTYSEFQLRCKIIDMLGHEGTLSWLNGSVDVITPSINFSLLNNAVVSPSTSVSIGCIDSSGCSLTQIAAKYQSGSTIIWYTTNVSGPSFSGSLSSWISSTNSGYIELYAVAEDNVGNFLNSSVNGIVFLYGPPTLSTRVDSTSHEHYLLSNASFTFIPSTGWVSGLLLNISITHVSNASPLFSGIINQTTASVTYTNLTEGSLWVNSTICDATSRCTNATQHFIIDLTGPSMPSIFSADSVALQNGSLVLQSGDDLMFSSGSDGGSGTSFTRCNGTGGIMTFSSANSSTGVQSILSSNTWDEIRCVSYDHLGNLGSVNQTQAFLDTLGPQLSTTIGDFDGVVVPQTWFNVSCSDNFMQGTLNLRFFNGLSLLDEFNGTSSISVKFDDIINLNSNQNITTILLCYDLAGNSATQQDSLEYLHGLEAGQLALDVFNDGNVLFINNASVVQLSHDRSDVDYRYRILSNGTYSSWILFTGQSSVLNLSTYSHLDNIRIQHEVSFGNSSLVNTSLGPTLILDSTGPTFSINQLYSLANGSLAPLSVTDSGSGPSLMFWRWDNGSLQQTTNLSNVVLPSSLSNHSWLEIYSVDEVGNLGEALSLSVSRDLSAPSISVNSSHLSYFGPNSQISGEIYDDTGLQSTTISFHAGSVLVSVLATNVSSYSITNNDLPSWFWNQSSVEIRTSVQSNSGHFVVSQFYVVPDNVAPSHAIVESLSQNYTSLNSSNYSEMYLQSSQDISTQCVRIGGNVSAVQSASCLEFESSIFSVSRNSGSYYIIVSSTDYAGNTNTEQYLMEHFTQPPTISHSLPSILRPGLSYSFSVSTGFTYETSIRLNNTLIGTGQSNFTLPSEEGNRLLEILIVNALGLQQTLSLNITLDDSSPQIDFSGELYSNHHFGTNTSISFVFEDDYSNLSSFSLYFNSTSTSCTLSQSLSGTEAWLNVTFSTLLPSSCTILQEANTPVSLIVLVSDDLGHGQRWSRNLTYHGSISPLTWSSVNSSQGSGFVWSSGLSRHVCAAHASTISPTYVVHWSSTNQTFQNTTLSNLSGDGIATCTVNDTFGNSGHRAISIRTDSTPPVVNLTWPSASFQNFIRSNVGHFFANATDDSSILSVHYCISSAVCSPLTQTTGIIGSLPSRGNFTLYLKVVNGVGLTTTSSHDFVVDDSLPTQEISSVLNSTIGGNVIYVGMVSPAVNLFSEDEHCIDGATYRTSGGTISLSANASISIPLNVSWIEFVSIDCVGHTTSSNYTVQQIGSISTQPIAALPSTQSLIHPNGAEFFHSGNASFLMNTSHPVSVNINCSVQSSSSCSVLGIQNSFRFDISSSLTSEMIELELTDALGNRKVIILNLRGDFIPGTCVPDDFVSLLGTTLVIPANRPSFFSCTDSGSGIASIAWDSSSGVVQWAEQGNGTWIAPTISQSAVQLVIVDRVGNERRTNYAVILDSSPPVPSIIADNAFINFDQMRTRSDGRFAFSCNDAVFSSCEINVGVEVLGTGEHVYFGEFVNNGEISLVNLPQTGSIRIIVNTTDELHNSDTQTHVLVIDDVDPVFSLSSLSYSGVSLPEGIVSANGSIQLSGLSSDVNNSLSPNIEFDCGPGTQGQTIQFEDLIDLRELNLVGCSELNVYAIARDHVGNEYSESKVFAIDFFQPEVAYNLDSTCSKPMQNAVDITSSCIVEIQVSDDGGRLLGNYTLSYLVDSEVVHDELIGRTHRMPLSQFEGEIVTLRVSGFDKVGNLVSPNSAVFAVSDELEPIWTGIVCSGGTVCDMRGDVEAAPTGDEITIMTSNLKADIAAINITLVNIDQAAISFNTPVLPVEEIPDGEYLLSINIEDEIGRTTITQAMKFVFDSSKPEIEVIQTRSTGLLEDGRVLACEGCFLAWKVNDLTNSTSFTNHGIEVVDGAQYVMETSLLGGNTINITAIDDFGRKSHLEFSSVSIISTKVEPVTSRQEYDSVHVHCIEIEPELSVRQVKCLWTRKQPTISNIPVAIDVFIDQEELRNVQLVMRKPGSSAIVLDITDGSMLISDIYSYDPLVNLELVDKYSQTNTIQLQMVEHNRGWESVDLFTSTISEEDETSTITFNVHPPADEGRHLVLERGYAELSDYYTCSVEYTFKTSEQKQFEVPSEACTLPTESVVFLPNGTMQLSAIIDHGVLRNEEHPFSQHPAYLFNLLEFRIVLEYSDVFGVRLESGLNELTIGENIPGTVVLRTDDSKPVFNQTVSPSCPLNFDSRTKLAGDGYMQSQASFPMSECTGALSDEDGIRMGGLAIYI
ncbi:hypothetical protein [Candidatus Poseidonia alphae]|uniref:beta strand repeat-containing protein n=1 Tax=Candidatus Poseidonia alphae TaxID=1915863 RepID=UPI0030C765B9